MKQGGIPYATALFEEILAVWCSIVKIEDHKTALNVADIRDLA